ncbi:MAG TPA: hypothetical protein VEF04_10615, partial [Blastocatellia bacterium]|nr:hypothetical protein [Blastocatellia bacterium]
MHSLIHLSRRLLAISLIYSLLASLTTAQSPTANNAERYFPSDQMMTIGVYYYPEAWPSEQWERDISNIKRFGFEF